MNQVVTSIDNTILLDDSLYANINSSSEIIKYRPIQDTLTSYDDFKNAKLNIKQLKEYCKKYKQKISGNKLELKERLLVHLTKISKAKIIQRKWRLYIIKKYNSAKGPARIKRGICLNDTDFFTTETMINIPMNQFISFKDIDERIYGFDILSLYNLYKKTIIDSEFKNPYNRNEIPSNVIENMFVIIRLSKLLHENIEIVINPPPKVTQIKKIEFKAIELFQYIDNLGNYTDPRWFLSLGRNQTDLFIKELFDIWNYRSQITHEIKREICDPDGNPFQYVLVNYLFQKSNEELKEIALQIIENMIKRGRTASYKALGANYVLCALTLVSQQAAASLPWLYQSVVHH
jgi:hypothetical protein